MKSSEFNNVLNNKYTRADVLSSLELNNLITTPRKKEGKHVQLDCFEQEDLALLRHISFRFTTKSFSYFRYLKKSLWPITFLISHTCSQAHVSFSCISTLVFCSWVKLSDTEYLQNMMSSKIKLMGLLHAPLKRGRKAHFFYVFIILMIIRTSACWSSSRDNSYLPTILLNVACL